MSAAGRPACQSGDIGVTVATFVIVPAMYRAGLYTNSEYLEHRFGPGTRVLGALIQIQYRTSVLGLMIWAVHLTLVGVGGLRPGLSWALIVSLVVLSGVYTAVGGLRAVVATDVLQSVLVMAGGLAVCVAVRQAVGGWDAMVAQLESLGTTAEGLAPGLAAADLTHVGAFRGRDGTTSPAVIFIAWILISSGWWTVSHTSTQRMMGARSLWDMKMAGVLGAGVSLVILLFTDMLGLFGRAQFPDFARPDEMYPHLISTYLGTGAVTRTNRRVGMAGLATGGLYGVVGFVDREVVDVSWLPSWLTGQWEAFVWAVAFTAAGCALAALHPRWRRTTGVVASGGEASPPGDASSPGAGGWLAKSSGELGPIRLHPFRERVPLLASPALYTGVLLAISAWLVFGVFW